MSELEAYRAKQEFIADSETRLRRKLNATEKGLLELIYSRIIDKLDTEGGAVKTSARNQNLLNTLGQIHSEYTKPASIKIAAQFANDVMRLPTFGEKYFGVISPKQADQIAQVKETSEGLLRAKLGLTESMDLKGGGYLQSVIEDVTVRNKIRALVARAIDLGGSVDTVRFVVNDYLMGKEDGPGALTRQAEGQLFDTFMEADRFQDNEQAVALGLQGAVYTGGLIETTRRFCCELDRKAWTRDEMTAMNDRANSGHPWGGYKGDVEVYCGGWNCRHGWRWIGNSALIRMRPDLEIIKGTRDVRQKIGVSPQPVNTGCEQVKRPKKAK